MSMRIITLIVSLVTAVVVIALLARILPPSAASILLDINRSTWPLTVQNILWLAFFASFAVKMPMWPVHTWLPDAHVEAALERLDALLHLEGVSDRPPERLVHSGHESHDKHAGHSPAMFRDRFWVSLVLSIPVLLYSPMIQDWLGFTMPDFPGSQWIALTHDPSTASGSAPHADSREMAFDAADFVRCGRDIFASKPVELSATDFQKQVLDSELPVLVDFWAAWCGPCRAVGPTIEQLAEQFEGSVKVGKLNIDENPQAPRGFGIHSIPAVLLFKDGKVVDQMFLDGLEDAYDKGRLMGTFAEDCVDKYGFTREQQDGFAIDSLERALADDDGDLLDRLVFVLF